MRFQVGPFPKSTENPPGVWTPLRELRLYALQLFGILIGGVVFVIVGWLWIHETPAMKNLGATNPNVLALMLIVAMFALIPIHEFLHAIVHPKFGTSHKTILGIWPSRLLCYAYYDGIRSRNRFIATLAMPLLVMTVAPLFIAIVSGRASVVVGFVSSLNALGSGMDIFGIGLLLWNVPQHAVVCNRAGRTLWSHTKG